MYYYLGAYKSKHIEDFNPSGSQNAISFKMQYIIDKIKINKIPITVVSSYVSSKNGFYPYRRVKVDELQTDCYLPSLRLSGLTGIFRIIVLFLFLLFKIKKDDTLILYHAPMMCKIMIFFKKLKKFKLILEVEEVFYHNNKEKKADAIRKKEEKIFQLADSYIVVNDLIYDKYLNKNKKHVVIYGAFNADDIKTSVDKKTDNITHVLFSGSIDRVRGADLAVATAAHLNRDYVLHISGFGNEVEMNRFEKLVNEHNASQAGCPIIVHGQLSNEELDNLAYSCDIGLNLQDINNPFEMVSYPSKISFYLMHGLNVVSTKMSSVLASSLSSYMNYCDQSPESVAEAIYNINKRPRKENQKTIIDLDKKIEKYIMELFNGTL